MTNPSEIHPLLHVIKTQTNRSSPEVYLMLPQREDIRREVYFETVQYCILFILTDTAKTIKKPPINDLGFSGFCDG